MLPQLQNLAAFTTLTTPRLLYDAAQDELQNLL
jgi:hypothetical protein